MTPKRRIYLDLTVEVADMAKNRAHDMRVPTKRYIEALIEKDCARKEDKKQAKAK